MGFRLLGKRIRMYIWPLVLLQLQNETVWSNRDVKEKAKAKATIEKEKTISYIQNSDFDCLAKSSVNPVTMTKRADT